MQTTTKIENDQERHRNHINLNNLQNSERLRSQQYQNS